MLFIKKYFNIFVLIFFSILILISISFIIKENLKISNNIDYSIKKINNNFQNFLNKSKINFVYTNIYSDFDKNNNNYSNFLRNKNTILKLFYEKIDYTKNYYRNKNKLPIIKEDNYYFIPFEQINIGNSLNSIDFNKMIKSYISFKSFDNKNILVNYIWIKSLEKDFFILVSLPYDYDINYIDNKRAFIIISEENNKKYSRIYQVKLN